MLYERIIDNAWAYQTAQELFRETCKLRAEKVAIVYKDQNITYKELQERVDALTQALIDAGVGKGDVVATLPTATPDQAVVWFAVLQAGAIINPLNLMWERNALSAIMKRNHVKAMITVGQYNKRDYIEILEQCYGARGDDNADPVCPRPPILIVTEDAGVVPDELPEGYVRLSEFVAKPEDVNIGVIEERIRSCDWSTIQYICMSSGSTGLPKSGLWNHRSPMSTAHFLAVNLGIKEDYRWMNLCPFFHNSGMTFQLLMGLAYAGLTTYLQEKFDPDGACEIIQRERIEATFGFAAHVVALRQSAKYDADKFLVKRFFYAGLPNFWSFVREMTTPETRIMGLYAQTENGPAVTFHEPGNINEAIRGINHGRPLGGVQVKIRNLDTGELCRDDEPGKIWYKSPFLFQGYLQEDGSIVMPVDEDGYFDSGDYGVMTDGGYLTWIERLGGVVKSGGENVALNKVTVACTELFKGDLDGVYAVSIPDDYWGDRVVCLGRPKVPGAITIADFKARCKDVLAAYEIPRNFLEWEGVWPATPEGKTDFKTLKAFAIERVDTSVR